MMSKVIRISALLAISLFGLTDAQCGCGGGMMSGMMSGGMGGGMMGGGMGSCCCPCPPPPQPVQLMLCCPPQQMQQPCCPQPQMQQPCCQCCQPVQLQMCCPPPPKPCCCCPEPPKCCCCPPMMDQPKCCQLMLIPTGQEVMMPCPKPCCCPPQMSSGMGMMGCGGMMGRKRRSIALYRRNGLYERLTKGSNSSPNAFGSNFAHHPKAVPAKYGKCVPCTCSPQMSAASPLTRILNPKFASH